MPRLLTVSKQSKRGVRFVYKIVGKTRGIQLISLRGLYLTYELGEEGIVNGLSAVLDSLNRNLQKLITFTNTLSFDI